MCKTPRAKQSMTCFSPAGVQQNIRYTSACPEQLAQKAMCKARPIEACCTRDWQSLMYGRTPDTPLHVMRQNNMYKASCARQSVTCFTQAAGVRQNIRHTSACAEQQMQNNMCKTESDLPHPSHWCAAEHQTHLCMRRTTRANFVAPCARQSEACFTWDWQSLTCRTTLGQTHLCMPCNRTTCTKHHVQDRVVPASPKPLVCVRTPDTLLHAQNNKSFAVQNSMCKTE
jgi:hypothetical protein